MRPLLLAPIIGLVLTAPLASANATVYTFTNFDAPGALEAQAYGTYVYGINNVGQVVGFVSGSGTLQGFVLDPATGHYTTYDGLYLRGINDSGQLIGYSYNRPAFVLDPATGIFTNVFPSAISSITIPTGIDNTGQVVGSYTTGPHAFPSTYGVLFDPATGATTDLTDPAGVSQYSQATGPSDINNRGQVVGGTGNGLTPDQGFLLDMSTGLYTNFSYPGAVNTGASGLNDVGQVVGSYYPTYSGADGFVLDLATGTYTTLIDPDPSAVSTFATGISNDGKIVGFYADRVGAAHGFIATPEASTAVPEPASMTLLAGSVFGLYGARHSRRRAVSVLPTGKP